MSKLETSEKLPGFVRGAVGRLSGRLGSTSKKKAGINGSAQNGGDEGKPSSTIQEERSKDDSDAKSNRRHSSFISEGNEAVDPVTSLGANKEEEESPLPHQQKKSRTVVKTKGLSRALSLRNRKKPEWLPSIKDVAVSEEHVNSTPATHDSKNETSNQSSHRCNQESKNGGEENNFSEDSGIGSPSSSPMKTQSNQSVVNKTNKDEPKADSIKRQLSDDNSRRTVIQSNEDHKQAQESNIAQYSSLEQKSTNTTMGESSKPPESSSLEQNAETFSNFSRNQFSRLSSLRLSKRKSPSKDKTSNEKSAVRAVTASSSERSHHCHPEGETEAKESTSLEVGIAHLPEKSPSRTQPKQEEEQDTSILSVDASGRTQSEQSNKFPSVKNTEEKEDLVVKTPDIKKVDKVKYSESPSSQKGQREERGMEKLLKSGRKQLSRIPSLRQSSKRIPKSQDNKNGRSLTDEVVVSPAVQSTEQYQQLTQNEPSHHCHPQGESEAREGPSLEDCSAHLPEKSPSRTQSKQEEEQDASILSVDASGRTQSEQSKEGLGVKASDIKKVDNVKYSESPLSQNGEKGERGMEKLLKSGRKQLSRIPSLRQSNKKTPKSQDDKNGSFVIDEAVVSNAVQSTHQHQQVTPNEKTTGLSQVEHPSSRSPDKKQPDQVEEQITISPSVKPSRQNLFQPDLKQPDQVEEQTTNSPSVKPSKQNVFQHTAPLPSKPNTEQQTEKPESKLTTDGKITDDDREDPKTIEKIFKSGAKQFSRFPSFRRSSRGRLGSSRDKKNGTPVILEVPGSTSNQDNHHPQEEFQEEIPGGKLKSPSMEESEIQISKHSPKSPQRRKVEDSNAESPVMYGEKKNSSKRTEESSSRGTSNAERQDTEVASTASIEENFQRQTESSSVNNGKAEQKSGKFLKSSKNRIPRLPSFRQSGRRTTKSFPEKKITDKSKANGKHETTLVNPQAKVDLSTRLTGLAEEVSDDAFTNTQVHGEPAITEQTNLKLTSKGEHSCGTEEQSSNKEVRKGSISHYEELKVIPNEEEQPANVGSDIKPSPRPMSFSSSFRSDAQDKEERPDSNSHILLDDLSQSSSAHSSEAGHTRGKVFKTGMKHLSRMTSFRKKGSGYSEEGSMQRIDSGSQTLHKSSSQLHMEKEENEKRTLMGSIKKHLPKQISVLGLMSKAVPDSSADDEQTGNRRTENKVADGPPQAVQELSPRKASPSSSNNWEWEQEERDAKKKQIAAGSTELSAAGIVSAPSSNLTSTPPLTPAKPITPTTPLTPTKSPISVSPEEGDQGMIEDISAVKTPKRRLSFRGRKTSSEANLNRYSLVGSISEIADEEENGRESSETSPTKGGRSRLSRNWPSFRQKSPKKMSEDQTKDDGENITDASQHHVNIAPTSESQARARNYQIEQDSKELRKEWRSTQADLERSVGTVATSLSDGLWYSTDQLHQRKASRLRLTRSLSTSLLTNWCPGCQTPFSSSSSSSSSRIKIRRSIKPTHCRMCSNVYCKKCLKYPRRLDKQGNYDPTGIEYMVCQNCFKPEVSEVVEIGIARSHTSEFTKYRDEFRIYGWDIEKAYEEYRFEPTYCSILRQCKRLQEGYGRSLHDKTAVSALAIRKGPTPEWQKAPTWVDASNKDVLGCQLCSKTKFVPGYLHNCRTCGRRVCNQDSTLDLMLYLPDEGTMQYSLPNKPQCKLICIAGCPSAEPTVHLYLRICYTCKKKLTILQERLYTYTADTMSSEYHQCMEAMDKIHQETKKMKEKIQQRMPEFAGMVEKLVSDSKNLPEAVRKALANHQGNLIDQFPQYLATVSKLRELSPQTDQQVKLVKNIKLEKFAFYQMSSAQFQGMVRRMMDIMPKDEIEQIKMTVDTDAINCTCLVMKQLALEVLHISLKHDLSEDLAGSIKEVYALCEDDLKQMISSNPTAEESWQSHSENIDHYVKSELLGGNRFIKLDRKKANVSLEVFLRKECARRIEGTILQLQLKSSSRSFKKTKEALERLQEECS